MQENVSENPSHKAFEGSKIHKTIQVRARFAQARKDLFPNMPIFGWDGDEKILTEQYGYVLAPKNANEQGFNTRELSYSLEQYGRSDFIPMVFESIDGTKFIGMYRKGVGGADEKATDFNSIQFGSYHNPDVSAGFSGEQTPIAEGKLANELHKKGMRIRLPIMNFYIDSVVTKDGVKTIEELVQQGLLNKEYLENRPMLSYWARRNMYTFRDAYITANKDPKKLLMSQVIPLSLENDLESKKVSKLIKDQSKNAEKEWFRWMTKKAGQQLSLYAKIGFIHPNFTDQNMTLAIETGDIENDNGELELKPMTKESPLVEKQLFATQTLDMLLQIISLKEYLNGAKKLGIKHRPLAVVDIINTYFSELNKSEIGIELMESILKMINDNADGFSRLKSCETPLKTILNTLIREHLIMSQLKRLIIK
jgi:hypothetical protein